MNKTIHTIPNSEAEEIRIVASEHHGVPLVHVRKYWFNGDKWIATKRGIALRAGQIEQCISGLQDAISYVRDNRLGQVNPDE